MEAVAADGAVAAEADQHAVSLRGDHGAGDLVVAQAGEHWRCVVRPSVHLAGNEAPSRLTFCSSALLSVKYRLRIDHLSDDPWPMFQRMHELTFLCLVKCNKVNTNFEVVV